MKNYEIHISQEDRERWTPPLLEFYTINKGMEEEEALEAIDKLFKEVAYGWNRAPHKLETRIQQKTGFQWQNHENLNPNKPKIEDIELEFKKDKTIYVEKSFLYEHLTEEEKKWWDYRIDEYYKEFSFNESSDRPLLTQLMFEELLQRRLFLKRLKSNAASLNKEMTDSLKRISELQVKLGITREQRAGILDNIDGNVADIAVHLDKKLEVMPQQLKQMYDEEVRYQKLKNQRPPVNTLPPRETMKAILNKESTGGKIEVTGNAIQEISELVSNQSKDKKAEYRDLPDGERV